MPPEQWSWDRKEAFFRDRKHERSEPVGFPHHGGGGGPRDFYRWGPPDFRRPPGDRREMYFKDRRYERFDPIGPPPLRWRDSYHHNNYARSFHRWGGSPDFRRPPGGFGKQGSWHMFAEESGNGYGPSRPSDRSMDGDGFRPYSYRGSGRYSSRNGKDTKSSFSQRDWRGGGSGETASGSPTATGRLHGGGGDRRSADNVPTNSSHPESGLEKSGKSNQAHSKEQQEKSRGFNGSSICQNINRENRESSLPVSTDWKPLKWTRSGSLSSRGLSSSCTRGIEGDDSNMVRAISHQKNTSAVQSPSGDAANCETTAVPVEETTLQRKHRLGWGEGLAKYEKKRVEGTDESEKNECMIASTNMEPTHSVSSNLAGKSPGIAGSSYFSSPETPSSVACSSSSGLDEKSIAKPSNADDDLNDSCGLIGTASKDLEGFSFELERLGSTLNNLGSVLIELLQSDETVSVDYNFVRSIAMNKLLVLKGDVLKDLEITESRVDSLENELKSISNVMDNNSSLPVSADIKSRREQHTVDAVPHSSSLQINASGDMSQDKIILTHGMHSDDKGENIESPGTATSKFSEPIYIENAVLSWDIANGTDYSGSLSAMIHGNVESRGFTSVSPGGGTKASGDSRGLLPEIDNGGSSTNDLSKEDDLYKLIVASNKELADEASKEIFNLSPKGLSKSYMPEHCDLSRLQNVSAIREKFVAKKRLQKFKERLLAIKFQTLQHLWKQDLDVPILKRSHTKPQRKIEFALHSVQGGCQKRRSAIRSQAKSLARNFVRVPYEVIDFTRKLLQDFQPKVCRINLKMPALIVDEESIASRFINSNGLSEDPCAVERDRALINAWVSEEKEIFMDKFAIFGKNFRKIASFLEHKTTADCVEFYYKNHKSDCFVKTKKHDFGKQAKSSVNTYLLTSQKRWDREMNAVSLDMPGMASVTASGADDSAFKQPLRAKLFFSGFNGSKATHVDYSILKRRSSDDNFGNERESVAADVLAGMCSSLSEAMSSCVTSSVDSPKNGELVYQKIGSRKRPWTPGVAEIIDETCSDESCEEMRSEDWTEREKSVFIQALTLYGKDFSAISRLIRTKSCKQCKVYFSKARKCLGLDSLYTGPGVLKPSASDNADDSGSDVDDVCAVGRGSVVCSDNVGLKLKTEMVTSMTAYHCGSSPVKKIKVEPGVKISELRLNYGVEVAGHTDGMAVETLVTGACQSKVEINNIVYDSPKKTNALHSKKDVDSLVDSGIGEDKQLNQGGLVAASLSFKEITNPVPSSSDSVNEETLVTETGRGGAGNDVEVSESLVLENHTSESQDEVRNTHAGSTCLQGPEKEPSTVMHSPETRFRQEHLQLQAIPEFSTVDQPVVSVPKECFLPCGNSLTQCSAMVGGEGISVPDRSSSTHDHHESKDDEPHNVSGDSHKLVFSEELPGHHHAESSNILQGFPLQSPSEIKVNRDFSGESASQVKSKSSNIQTSAQDKCLKRCGNSKYHKLTSEDHKLSSEHAQCLDSDITSSESPPPLHSSSDSEKPSKVRDVRLFGKIISRSSPHERSTTEVQKSDEGRINQPMQSKSSTLKSSGDLNADGNTALLRFDQNNSTGSDNLSSKNYEYWSRLQHSVSTMHDSAILLSKYPAAVPNFTTLPSQKQQQFVGSNNCIINGAFSREMSGNEAVDFQIYRGQNGANVQPFTVDMTQYEDLYSEMQRCNGFKAMSTLHGSGSVSVDVLSRVGDCHSVQDPVTAIRRQYAKADQCGGHVGTSSGRNNPDGV